MEPVAVAPQFVAERPILRWLDPAFHTLAKRVHIPARSLTDLWPPVGGTADLLRVELERRAQDKEPTDDLWAAIVGFTRQPGETGRVWRLLACGLALTRLRLLDRRLSAATVHERAEIHADLIEGFLKRLSRIDTGSPNILNRLVDAAKYRAGKQRDARLTHIPADVTRRPPSTRLPSYTESLTNIAAAFDAAGYRLDPQGLELIARTVLDRQHLTQAAAELRLTTEAAYKRRQRTEERLAAFYRISTRRAASGRSTAVNRDPDARGDEA